MGGTVSDFGTWIREHRKSLGLSQTELALKVDSNQVYVSQWENGKRSPSPAELAALTALFGTDSPVQLQRTSQPTLFPMQPKPPTPATPAQRTLPLGGAAVSEVTADEFARVAGQRNTRARRHSFGEDRNPSRPPAP